MFRKFSEYLDVKSKNQDKAILDPFADTAIKPPKTPEKFATKGKGWEDKAALADKPEDYYSASIPGPQLLAPKGEKNGKALSQEGDPRLIYEPKTKIDKFLYKTKNMSLAEFTAYIASENKVEGDPVKTIRSTVAMANANDNILTALVIEFKRNSGLDRLVKEMFEHQETYLELASLMSDENNNHAKRLTRALNEITAPPATAGEIDTGPDDEEPQPARKPVRSIGNSNNQMDLSGGQANVMASPGGGKGFAARMKA